MAKRNRFQTRNPSFMRNKYAGHRYTGIAGGRVRMLSAAELEEFRGGIQRLIAARGLG